MFGAHGFADLAPPTSVKAALESDDELRKRILYVGGDGEKTTAAIKIATGDKLDEWAWRLGLKRRRA